jgi:Na+/H+-dicarboxylate symporter
VSNSPSFSRIVWILLFSVVTPIFAAGVPFAAVFALGLVLQYTTGLSGPAWWVMSIEPLLDPIVTVVNVIGNLFVSTCSAPHQTEEDVPCLKQHAAA